MDFLPGDALAGTLSGMLQVDLVLEVLEDLVLEGRLRPRFRLPRGLPVAGDLEPGGVEQVEDGLPRAVSVLGLGLGVDVPAGVELGGDLERHGVAGPGLGRLDRRARASHPWAWPGWGCPSGPVVEERRRPPRAEPSWPESPERDSQRSRKTKPETVAETNRSHGQDPVEIRPPATPTDETTLCYLCHPKGCRVQRQARGSTLTNWRSARVASLIGGN